MKIYATILCLLISVFTVVGQQNDSADIQSNKVTKDSSLVALIQKAGQEEAARSVEKYKTGKIKIEREKTLAELKLVTQDLKFFLEQGIDSFRISQFLTKSKDYLELVKDGVFTHVGTIQTQRDLSVSFVILNELLVAMEANKVQVDNYVSSLVSFRDRIDSINSVSALYTFPSDSVETLRYYKKLAVIVKEIGPPDSALETAMVNVEDLQTSISEHVFELKTYIEKIDKLKLALAKKGLKREVPGLFEPAANHRPVREILQVSIIKEAMALEFYLKDNKGRVLLLLILIGGATFFLYQLRRKTNDTINEVTETNFALHKPFLSAVIIIVCIFQFLFLNPPFIFSYLLWFVAVFCLSLLFVKILSGYWMRFWLIIMVLFLLAGVNNMVLQASRAERWLMFFLSVLSAGYGMYVLLCGHRRDLKEKKILYFIAFMVIFEMAAAIANLTGRYNLAKTFMVSGLTGLVIAILFLWTLRLMNQALSLTSKVYRRPDKKLFYINFEKLGQKVPAIFYVLLVLGWVVLVGKNFYQFQQISRGFNSFLNTERNVGDYSFSVNGLFVFLIIITASGLLSKIISFFASDPVAVAATEGERKRVGLGSWLLLIRIFIISMGLFLAFAASGIPLDKITIILGALGVGIGLGLQGLVNNLVSGLIIAFEKPVNVGDTIEVSGKPGMMKSIGFRSSVVTLSDGASLIIPNGDLLSQHLINWSMGQGLKRISLIFQVRYNTNLETALKLVHQEINKDNRIVRKPSPAVAPKAFGSSAIEIEIQYWINQADLSAMDIHGKLIMHITQAFSTEGIEIAYPQQELFIKGFLEKKEEGDNKI